MSPSENPPHVALRAGRTHGPSNLGDALASAVFAVQVTRFGGPDVLETVDVPTAVVNYADTHHAVS